MDPESAIERAVEVLADEMSPRRIVLLGPPEGGDADADSDGVLLVILDRFDSRFAEMGRASALLAPLRVPFDVLVYSVDEVAEWGDVVNHVLNEAALDGRVVYEAE